MLVYRIIASWFIEHSILVYQIVSSSFIKSERFDLKSYDHS